MPFARRTKTIHLGQAVPVEHDFARGAPGGIRFEFNVLNADRAIDSC